MLGPAIELAGNKKQCKLDGFEFKVAQVY